MFFKAYNLIVNNAINNTTKKYINSVKKVLLATCKEYNINVNNFTTSDISFLSILHQTEFSYVLTIISFK